jgi:hypothetical protein
VGLNLDTKSYGIAVPEGSALRPLVSSAVIRLKEEGTIAALKRKWWQEERGGGACQAGFPMKLKKKLHSRLAKFRARNVRNSLPQYLVLHESPKKTGVQYKFNPKKKSKFNKCPIS